jgi:hypothetical protein
MRSRVGTHLATLASLWLVKRSATWGSASASIMHEVSPSSSLKDAGGVVSSVASPIASGRGEGEAGSGESWPSLEIARSYIAVSMLKAW